MRILILMLGLALLQGCASRGGGDDAELITRVGVITAREVVDAEEIHRHRQVTTGVSVSSGTGGSGVSIGLGFLFSPWSSSSSSRPPVRYQVELLDGEQVTVYHESDLFEVDDCVEITSRADDDRDPPIMRRLKNGCTDDSGGAAVE